MTKTTRCVYHQQGALAVQVDITDSGPMRPAIFDTMQPIMQQWAGGVSLQVCDLFVLLSGCQLFRRTCCSDFSMRMMQLIRTEQIMIVCVV